MADRENSAQDALDRMGSARRSDAVDATSPDDFPEPWPPERPGPVMEQARDAVESPQVVVPPSPDAAEPMRDSSADA